jgi:hypothetical protein
MKQRAKEILKQRPGRSNAKPAELPTPKKSATFLKSVKTVKEAKEFQKSVIDPSSKGKIEVYMDLIIYTGFGFPGRDLLLTRSADAVVCGCGRIGTIHEFAIAFEDNKPLGIYKGPWEMGDELEDIVAKSHRVNSKLVRGDDPKKLVSELIALIKKDKISEFNIISGK